MVKKNKPQNGNTTNNPTKITKQNKTKSKNSNVEIINEDSVEIIEEKISEPEVTFDIKTIEPSTVDFKEEDVSNFFKANAITISGKQKFTPNLTFASTNFPKDILKKLEVFDYPTPIQAISWPIVRQKNNVVSIAKTGSGKTLAFVVPAIMHARKHGPLKEGDGPVVLVLTPTRELAQQIHGEFQKFGRSLKVTCVYGGIDYTKKKNLKGTQVLIATPGRLNDLLDKDFTNMNTVSFLTLDEADQMLDMGFEVQIKRIVSKISKDRQTCLFSATWKPNVKKIAQEYCPNEIKINIGKYEVSTNDAVKQHFIPFSCVRERINEFKGLVINLRKKDPKMKMLVFSGTKKGCTRLNELLGGLKIRACEIHGDIDQRRREKALSQFKSNEVTIMIATDVAARGLDISDVSVVINFDFARDIENYVHRIGRTGRAGKTGEAYTFIGETEDIQLMFELKKILEKGNNPIPDCVKRYTDLSKSELEKLKGEQKQQRREKYEKRNNGKQNRNKGNGKANKAKNTQKFQAMSKMKKK
eukprot:gene2059-1565_t